MTQLQALPLNPTRANETTGQYWSTRTRRSPPLNGQPFLKDYTSAALAAETYNGKTYGIVSGEYQEGVFYNKTVFAKYHLRAPTTYSQFLSGAARR